MSQQSYTRQFFAFYKAQLTAQLRNPSAVIFGFLFPIVFLGVFGLIGNGSNSKLALGFVQSDSAAATQIKTSLEKTELFTIKVDTEDTLKQKIEKPSGDSKDELAGILKVADDGKITIFENKANPQATGTIQQVVSSLVDKIALAQNQVKPKFTVESSALQGRQTKYIDFALPGLLGFSLLTAGINGTAYGFMTLKKTNALKRLFASPAYVSAYILGSSLGRVTFSFVQNSMLIVLAMIAFQYTPVNGLWSIWQMLLTILVGIFMFMGMGYIVAGLARNEEQANPLTQLISLPQMLLGGTFFSIAAFPDWVQIIAKFLPIYSFNETLRSVAVSGYNLWEGPALQSFGFLALWTAVIYIIASRVFKLT